MITGLKILDNAIKLKVSLAKDIIYIMIKKSFPKAYSLYKEVIENESSDYYLN